jgi:hypothetical protein
MLRDSGGAEAREEEMGDVASKHKVRPMIIFNSLCL